MGSTSKYGRATINPTAPEALGICDRCSFLYNLRDLRFQWQWSGTGMINTQLRVCSICMDVPNEQMRAIVLPPDPPPAYQPRPEPYAVDEKNDYTLTKILGKPAMFAVHSEFDAVLKLGQTLSAVIDGISAMDAALKLGKQITAAIEGISDFAAELTIPVSYLLTEGGDIITTEAGDRLILED